MQVSVRLFAAYQEAVGASELLMELEADAVVAEVRDRLITQHPELARWRDVTRFGINLEFVTANTPLHSGDEVVLIPPVSGG